MKNPDLLKGKTVIKAWDGKYYVGEIVQVPYLYNKKSRKYYRVKYHDDDIEEYTISEILRGVVNETSYLYSLFCSIVFMV